MMNQTAGRSLTIPLLLAVAAPIAVIVGIEYLNSVWWTFAVYQVGICLVAPALESRLAGRNWREHIALLGLITPDRSGYSPRLGLAALLGVITALVTGCFLVLSSDRFLDPDRLIKTVGSWGVPAERLLFLLGVMAVLDAAAEELFWRGYFPGRVTLARQNGPPPAALTVVLPAVLYASYHAATIGRLVGNISGVMVLTAGVLGAGLVWGWLRRRTGSVWPPLLSHGGAVIAYLGVHFWLTRGSGR